MGALTYCAIGLLGLVELDAAADLRGRSGLCPAVHSHLQGAVGRGPWPRRIGPPPRRPRPRHLHSSIVRARASPADVVRPGPRLVAGRRLRPDRSWPAPRPGSPAPPGIGVQFQGVLQAGDRLALAVLRWRAAWPTRYEKRASSVRVPRPWLTGQWPLPSSLAGQNRPRL